MNSNENNQELQIEVVKIKLEQSVETIRSYLKSLIQIITTLVVANVTTIGFAVQFKQGVILFLGAFYYFGIWITFLIFGKLIAIPVFTIFCLEKNLETNQSHWPSISALPLSLPPDFIRKLYTMRHDLSNDTKNANKYNEIYKLRVPILGSFQEIVKAILIILTVLQIGIPFILHSKILPLW